MDVALDGVHWWSLMLLEGSSRTRLAGMIAPTAATWVALMVLYTACLRYGAPASLVSDRGGAYTSADLEAVCARLQIQHATIVRTEGESYLNWMETQFNIQRRLYDYQCSLARTPVAFEPRHQAFIHTDNTTAHQGLVHDRRHPAIPIEGLGAAKGRLYTPAELTRAFAQAVFPRTTNPYGGVRVPRDHCYVAAGLPYTRVLLWVSGEQWRAVWDTVVLAAYHCRDEWRDQRVTALRDGRWYTMRFASPQRTLWPLTPQDSRVVSHPLPASRRRRDRPQPQPVALFEWGHSG